MKHTWTIKELKETDMFIFVRACLYDRQDGLNIYGPLYRHIDKAIKWLKSKEGDK